MKAIAITAAIFSLLLARPLVGRETESDPTRVNGRAHIAAIPVVRNPKEYMARTIKGPLIPGLDNYVVPQGLAYLPDKDLYVISAYTAEKKKQELASCLLLVDATQNLPHKILWLQNPDGTMHKGHSGGVCSDGKRLWFASSKECYTIPLETVHETKDGDKITLTHAFTPRIDADFIAYQDDIVWVGDFKSRKPSKCFGYKVEDDGSVEEDDHGSPKSIGVLLVPEKVQGMTFVDDLLVLSASWGGANSSLHFYRSPVYDIRNQKPSAKLAELPEWNLQESYFIAKLRAPPMIEGIAWTPQGLAAVFESTAKIYIGHKRKPLVDHVRILPLR